MSELRVIGGPPGDACGECGKVAYRSRRAAQSSASYYVRRGRSVQRAYWSEKCGCWHLASRSR